MLNHTQIKAKEVSASTLTAVYAGNTAIFNVDGFNQMSLYVEHLPGENNAVLEVKIETGLETNDMHEKIIKNTGSSNVNIYLAPFKRVASTAGSVEKYTIPIELCDIWVRVSFKETATAYGTINFAIIASGKL